MALAAISMILVFSMYAGDARLAPLCSDLYSDWPEVLFYFQLLNLVTVFDLIDKYFGRLKAGNKMLINYQGGIAGDIAGNLFLSLLVDKAAETTNVNVITI